MDTLTKDEYQRLIANANIIEQDSFGVKVLETPQGNMVKLFRRKRLISTATLKPYAIRFVENATTLNSIGIPSVQIKHLYWSPSIKRHVVVYEKLEGQLLRDVLTNQLNKFDEIFQQFAVFIAELHTKGVYFRSAHLKNILLLPNGHFGLIDISDMQIKRRPLNIKLRQRNFEHILRYKEDKALFKEGFDLFTSTYQKNAQLPESHFNAIKETIQQIAC